MKGRERREREVVLKVGCWDTQLCVFSLKKPHTHTHIFLWFVGTHFLILINFSQGSRVIKKKQAQGKMTLKKMAEFLFKILMLEIFVPGHHAVNFVTSVKCPWRLYLWSSGRQKLLQVPSDRVGRYWQKKERKDLDHLWHFVDNASSDECRFSYSCPFVH